MTACSMFNAFKGENKQKQNINMINGKYFELWVSSFNDKSL